MVLLIGRRPAGRREMVAKAPPDGRPLRKHVRSDSVRILIVGAAGTFPLRAGDYVYVGSARGRGGLAARVGRHLKPAAEKRPRWHIDRLTAIATPIAVIAAPHSPLERLECAWATLLGQQAGVVRPIYRFGSSDCACAGHLFRWPQPIVPDALAALLR